MEGDASKLVSEIIGESRRIFSYEGKALEETRTIIDYQMDLIKEADNETIRLMRLNLVLLGAFVPLFITSSNILKMIIPWATISVLFSVISVGISSYIYRGWIMYGGFGDSPNLNIQSLREAVEENSSEISFSSLDTVDPIDVQLTDFQTLLIKDHEIGILHNNVELRYRNEINQETAILLLMSLLSLVLGGFHFINSQRTYEYILNIFTVIFVIFGIFHSIKALALLARFELRSEDDERLSWDHAFKRKHPILSQIFLFVLRIWDPKKNQ